MQNNKLIAEFMGVEEQDMSFRIPKEILKGIHENDCPNSNDVDCWDIPLKDLQYHTSWDWLMPVIEKIDHLQRERVQGIEDALSTRCLGDVYNAVVEFIVLHNDYN